MPNLILNIRGSIVFKYVALLLLQCFHIRSISSTEFQTLRDVYWSTNGSRWIVPKSCTRWNFTGNHNPCAESWCGISCSKAGISSLKLSTANLMGQIPTSISKLISLSSLVLDYNRFLNLFLKFLCLTFLILLFLQPFRKYPCRAWTATKCNFN